MVGRKGGEGFDVSRVLYRQGRDNGRGVAVQAGKGLDVGLQSGAAAGIMAGKGHYSGWLLHAADDSR